MSVELWSLHGLYSLTRRTGVSPQDLVESRSRESRVWTYVTTLRSCLVQNCTRSCFYFSHNSNKFFFQNLNYDLIKCLWNLLQPIKKAKHLFRTFCSPAKPVDSWVKWQHRARWRLSPRYAYFNYTMLTSSMISGMAIHASYANYMSMWRRITCDNAQVWLITRVIRLV